MKPYLFFLTVLIINIPGSFSQVKPENILDQKKIAIKHFGNDHQWYQNNIPFFECSDPKLEEVYYYRWELLKSHLRNIGKDGYILTEFLNEMRWDLKPYNSLNCATVFHIYEGRWLKDRTYIDDYINFMYKKGGNDRHFTEAIADAAYAYYLTNPDKKFITSQLPFMVKIYNAWNDHYDKSKQLYYSEPINDATEYTISSIDASGGKDGFKGGHSFRPSINSYMYANALAIKNISLLNKDSSTAKLFQDKAESLKKDFQEKMWHPEFQHFADRYKVDNEFVDYWDFIRGRELVGFVPWVYNLPDDNAKFNSAWKHVMDTSKFNAKFGLRTLEPSYQYYMKQYRYDKATGLKECQWNGPSWPYQTTQVLMGMANVLNNYNQQYITSKDYVDELRTYAAQHYFKDSLNLLENYHPDKGGAIVYINERSEHYNHSGFNNLIITGFCGLRSRADDVLEINPIITDDIEYFCLEDVEYHGRKVSILFDRTGKKYKKGKGLKVYADGKPAKKLSDNTWQLGTPIISPLPKKLVNVAVNVSGKGFPKASASFTYSPDSINMAMDGRIWNFKNVKNRWSCYGSGNKTDWYAVEFEQGQDINKIKLFFYADEKNFKAPKKYVVEYFDGNIWKPVTETFKNHKKPISGTEIFVAFKPVKTLKIRIVFNNYGNGAYTALSEVEAY